MKISTIIDQIDLGSIALPEFQRGYVWSREQVRGLMHSLYRRHPVGTLLVWKTRTENADTRGDGQVSPGYVDLLLDGQQRMTTLYGLVRGEPPKFFDGNPQTFTGLYFNLEEEIFEFYRHLMMKDNPLWVNVTEVLKEGTGKAMERIYSDENLRQSAQVYFKRLSALDSIKEYEFHVDSVTGEDKTVDVVVDIFNRVNSGGTRLSKGDLALARICARWPDARGEMKIRLARWERAGFEFKLEWYLRCINAYVCGKSLFSEMENIRTQEFRRGLIETEKAIDKLLNMISGRVGLDHDRVLGGKYAFPVLVRLITKYDDNINYQVQRDRMLFWYVNAMLWGRYSGSTESKIAQDLNSIEEIEDPIGVLTANLRQDRGDLNIQPNDFVGWSRGTRFYPLLYLLTRVWRARDWGSGIDLSSEMLGAQSSLHLHHIFPKALLYKAGFERPLVNSLANFTFLTQETNLNIADRAPKEYFEEIIQKQPGALESHWIPMDRELWEVENYKDFLVARRELLASAANDFLNSLLAGSIPEIQPSASVLDRAVVHVPGSIGSDEEAELLLDINAWVEKLGLAVGEFEYELENPVTGEALAIVDLAWPNGLQEGLSQPVALLIDEGRETIDAVSRAGYMYFTKPDEFKSYVKKTILGELEEEALKELLLS